MSHDERNANADSVLKSSREPARAGLGGTHESPSIDEAYFRRRYRDAPYYSTGRDWSDYAPAYRYGLLAHLIRPGQRFEDIEAALADGWNAARSVSRLLWAEARGAALDGWQLLDDHRGAHAGSDLRGTETH